MKNLYIVRGVPGSGKSTFAELICDLVVTADDYFMRDGEYKFNPKKLKNAHAWARIQAEDYMKAGEDFAVANTSTTEWEMKAYYELAALYGYRVFSVIVENRHGGKDVHNVPEAKLKEMRERFEIKL